MNDDLETLAAEVEIEEANAEEVVEETTTEAAVEAEETTQAETQQEPDRVKQYADKYRTAKGDLRLMAKGAKAMMDDLGLTLEEAAKYYGIQPNDLQARIDGADTPDNPFQAQGKVFDERFYNGGLKKVMDKIEGKDTQQFVDAFKKAVVIDAELADQFTECDPDEVALFVIEKGKEYAESGAFDVKTVKGLKARVAELEAKLANRETDERALPTKSNLPSESVNYSDIFEGR